MMRRIRFVLAVAVMSAFLPSLASAQDAQDTIVVGRISDNPDKHYKKYQPFAEYLARRLSPFGVREGKVLFAKDDHQMIKYLREGKVDIVTETPFSALVFIEKANARPILRRWKQGVPYYHTIFFARKDSGIRNLRDLVGKVVAFEDPGSTSGFLLPMSALMKEGLDAVELADAKQKPPPGKVGYVFAREENNIPHWVNRKLSDAGVLSSEEFDRPKVMPPDIRDACVVIAETESVPRNLILLRSGLDPRLAEAIKGVLLRMKDEKEGKTVMWKMEKTLDFDALPDGPDGTIKNFKDNFSYARKVIQRDYPE